MNSRPLLPKGDLQAALAEGSAATMQMRNFRILDPPGSLQAVLAEGSAATMQMRSFCIRAPPNIDLQMGIERSISSSVNGMMKRKATPNKRKRRLTEIVR